ncbi:hypothetical protein LINPERHAP2_LOCUS1982 [Linum perenne]
MSDKDLISDLPDGILHNIIHRLEYGDQAAQTIAISRRWETLWRSYPFVEFDIYNWRRRDCNRDFQKFAEATINRFTRDSLLRMEILKLTLMRKCEINNAGACRWELHIATEEITYYIDPQLWFPQFKNFMVRYPQFRTVYIDNVDHDIIAFDQNEVDNSVLPTAIDHLVVNGYVSIDDGNFSNFLDGLLWACRPKFIRLHCLNSSEILLEEFSSWYLLAKNSGKGDKEHCHRLKDAKIATEEEMKEEFRSFSKDMITLLNWGVWLRLTWY